VSDGRAPRVAVVGRQNVGKSTLVNRLLGRRLAIAHEMPGVTRDRVELPVRWRDRSFVIVDTGGFSTRARGIEQDVTRQATRAMEQADLILLVVDATAGIQEEDAQLAAALRRGTVPVVVVANKVDSETHEPAAYELYKLGLGEPVPVSALHGRGSGDLLDRVLELLPEGGEAQVEDEARFAIVGRPNVGKSSLFNRLVREERAVVHEIAGTTRDAVDSVVEVDGRRIRFVDTAGLRRAIKTKGVEYYGLLRSLKAMEAAHVALLVVDASEGLTGEDKHIAARVAEAGRGLAVVLNKWDLVPSEDRARLFRDLVEELRLFPGTPVVRTSARTGMGVGRVVPALLSVHEAWTRRVPTAEVNRVLAEATAAYPPPRTAGRILYATQVRAAPPSFVMFGTADPPQTYRRYLENSLRKAFRFDGVPVRLTFRIRRREGTSGPRTGRSGTSGGSGGRAG
jgi:GTPase